MTKKFKSEQFKVILNRAVKLWPALVYIIWFYLLEKHIPNDGNYILMHCNIDDIIPFCEYFIIPYLLWFPLMAAVFLYFLFTSEKDFSYCCRLIIGGMLVALAICTIFPNGQNLRPEISQLPDNIFGNLIATLYKGDTSTNVCPSIHVYNSVAACVVIWNSDRFQNSKTMKIISGSLALLISLSTMFLKQHSFIDVVCALLLAFIMYALVYKMPVVHISQKEKKEKIS
jgi:membrane-associated phospholipid phosphatase